MMQIYVTLFVIKVDVKIEGGCDMTYFSSLFKGRLSLGDFWGGSFLIGIIFAIAATFIPPMMIAEYSVSSIIMFVLFFLYVWSLLVRRAHDLNRSGMAMLNPFVYFAMSYSKGTDGDNKYGPPPNMKEGIIKRIFLIGK